MAITGKTTQLSQQSIGSILRDRFGGADARDKKTQSSEAKEIILIRFSRAKLKRLGANYSPFDKIEIIEEKETAKAEERSIGDLGDPLQIVGHLLRTLKPQKTTFTMWKRRTCKPSNLLDCRISAYPIYTEYYINRTGIAPTILVVDIDRRQFETSEQFELAAAKTLSNFRKILGSQHNGRCVVNANCLSGSIQNVPRRSQSLVASL